MWALPPWRVSLEVTTFGLAIGAIVLWVWDHMRVRFWDWYRPLKVRFDRSIINEYRDLSIRPPDQPSVLRIRFSIRSRVDYRTTVLLGGAFSSNMLGTVEQELLDQIDNSVIASTTKPGQLTTSVEAFQSKHLVQRVLIHGNASGTIIPSVTFLVGQRPGRVSRVSTWKRSVVVEWDSKVHRFRLVPTQRLPGSRRCTLVGY